MSNHGTFRVVGPPRAMPPPSGTRVASTRHGEPSRIAFNRIIMSRSGQCGATSDPPDDMPCRTGDQRPWPAAPGDAQERPATGGKRPHPSDKPGHMRGQSAKVLVGHIRTGKYPDVTPFETGPVQGQRANMTHYGASGRDQRDPGRGGTRRHARIRVGREHAGGDQDRVIRQPENDEDAAVDEDEREDDGIEHRSGQAIHTRTIRACLPPKARSSYPSRDSSPLFISKSANYRPNGHATPTAHRSHNHAHRHPGRLRTDA